LLSIHGFFAAVVTTAPVQASSSSDVEVRSVRFNLLHAPNTAARWFEADVEVAVRATGVVRFVDHVRVTLSLGLKTAGPGTHRYFRAAAEAPTLGAGAAHFRFYLPAEVVKRDGLRGEADLWAAELSVDGRPQPLSTHAAATALRDPAQFRQFQGMVAAEAPAADGILQPQYLTPFAAEYPRETPAFVRRN